MFVPKGYGRGENDYGDSIYSYDVFNHLTAIQKTNDTNPFRYCGEYYDSETDNIYLRARYYDPAISRMLSEDPAKAGINWYIYCNNNPVNYIDPTGLEYIILSGGRYSTDKSGGYEFIETSIKKLRELKLQNDGENITWLIADAGWDNSDKENFKDVAEDIGVNVRILNSTDDFVEYVNCRNGNDRYNDKIKKIAVYSHGKDTDGGVIELAYYHDKPNRLSISIDTIENQLWATAFDNPNSWFGACNLANGERNFTSKWQDKFGGKA